MNSKVLFFLGLFLTYDTIRFSYAMVDCSNVHNPSKDCRDRMITYMTPFNYNAITPKKAMTPECCLEKTRLELLCYYEWVADEVSNFSQAVFNDYIFGYIEDDLLKECETMTKYKNL